MTVLYIALLFFSTLASGLLYYLFRKQHQTHLKLILGFSGGFLLAVSLIHLIPETFASSNAYTGVFLLLGFYLQFVLDYFSHGLEHGHVHAHNPSDATQKTTEKNQQHHSHVHGSACHNHKSIPNSTAVAIPWIMFLSLCLHAVLEGLPLGLPIQKPIFNGVLITGIIVHNLPISIALVDLLNSSGTSRGKVLSLLALFSFMTPLGILLTGVLSGQLIENLHALSGPLAAFVIGIFLHLSTTILFESSENHRFQGKKLLSILLGSLIALGMLFLLP